MGRTALPPTHSDINGADINGADINAGRFQWGQTPLNVWNDQAALVLDDVYANLPLEGGITERFQVKRTPVHRPKRSKLMPRALLCFVENQKCSGKKVPQMSKSSRHPKTAKRAVPKRFSPKPVDLPDFGLPSSELLDLNQLGQELNAAHELALTMAAQAHDHLERAEQPGALAREFHTAHANASALAAVRLMNAYRQGLLAIHKLQGSSAHVIPVRHMVDGPGDGAKNRGTP